MRVFTSVKTGEKVGQLRNSKLIIVRKYIKLAKEAFRKKSIDYKNMYK